MAGSISLLSKFSSNAQLAQLEPAKGKTPAAKPAAEAKKAPDTTSTPSPSAIVSLGKSKPSPDLGLYSKSGLVGNGASQSKSPETRPAPQAKTPTPAKETTPPTAQAGPAAPSGATSTASGTYTAGSGQVVVDIMNSDSGYSNKIYWSSDNFATKHYLGIDNNTGSFNIGSFAPGTKIDFGIENDANQFFRTGSSQANFDGIQHAKATNTTDGVQIGFEDLAGGGDMDFNDAIIKVRTLPTADTKPPISSGSPTKPPAPEDNPPSPIGGGQQKGNSSGLGDGTNPGNGGGQVNSPNRGTDNPNNAGGSGTAPTSNPAPTQPTKSGATSDDDQDEDGPELDDVTNPGNSGGQVNTPNRGADKPAPTPPVDSTNQTSATQQKGNNSGLGDGTNPGNGGGRVNSPNRGTGNPNNAGGSGTAPTNNPAPTPPVDASKTTGGAQPQGNRSRLGDGTNPGNGGGQANSPNGGTNNPSGAGASTISPAKGKAATTSGKPVSASVTNPRIQSGLTDTTNSVSGNSRSNSTNQAQAARTASSPNAKSSKLA